MNKLTNAQKLGMLAYTLEHGGCTWDVEAGGPHNALPGTYAVAIGPQRSFTLPEHDKIGRQSNATERMVSLVRRFAWAVNDAEGAGAEFLGTWIDGGRCYVEPARVVFGLAAALELARENAQRAIWDFAAQEAIQIEPAEVRP